MRVLAFFLGIFVIVGCAHTNSQTVCSESRGLKCMTAPQCAMDAARGCQVCSCSPAFDPMAPTK
jgi:hypothetical protein